MNPTIKWNADLFGVEIKTKEEHFVISAQPSMVMSWNDARRYFDGNEEWQLPSLKQLKIAAEHIDDVNALIKANGGYEIQGLFWAADGSDEIAAWRVYIRDGDAYRGCKIYSNDVRAVSALKVK